MDNREEIKTNNIYTEIHEKMMTSNSDNTQAEPEEVDMSGALNASAALSASSALKTNSNTETVKDSTSEISSNKVDSSSENEKENNESTSPSSRGNITDPLKPEAFIDGIEKFVNFVSKEGLAKKMNESTSSIKKEVVEKTTENKDAPTDSQVENVNYTADDKKGSKKPTQDDDVDADLKSYALAVTDMLDNEVEVPADGNELDAEIKTMVVSNTDAGEVKMTFTDNAVGRFETIGKSDDKGDTLAEGLSPLRKSCRPKKRKVFADFDQPDDSELEKMVEEVSRAIANVEEKKEETRQKRKSKRKNPSPKKAKLTVEEVYETDSNEESDGDISKDTLKVTMAKCDICDKHFLDRKKLAEHKKRHKKSPKTQLDYPCVVCGKVFLKREHWRRHVKIHDDIRPYACPVCRKAFRRNEHVKRHMLVHTGEKPFECMICSQRYQRADHLKKHIQQHSKGTISERKRRSPGNSSTKTKKRKPTTKATELIVQSRKKKVKEEVIEPLEEHFSDGLSDEDKDNMCAE